MNYYKQFAEMLGLELGQEFNITSDDGERTSPSLYKIMEGGIFSRGTKDADGSWGLEQSHVIASLLIGALKAVPKPFKPEKGDRYWNYSVITNRACCSVFGEFIEDYAIWKSGNCFRTKEEAETKGKEIMEKLVKEYEEA